MSGVVIGIVLYIAVSLSGWAIIHGAKKSADQRSDHDY